MAWSNTARQTLHHIQTVKKAGIEPVVAINAFHSRQQTKIVGGRKAEKADRRPRGAVRALADGRRKGAGTRRRFINASTISNFQFLYHNELLCGNA